MHKEAREELMVRFKLAVIEYAKHLGASEACKEFKVPRSTFYRWKKKYNNQGALDFIGKNPSHIAILARHLLFAKGGASSYRNVEKALQYSHTA